MKIKLVMDEQHAVYLMRALEAIARCGMAQFEDMIELSAKNINYNKVMSAASNLRECLNLQNANNGIRSNETSPECQVAWDAYQHIRREVSWAREGKDWRTDKRDWSTMMEVSYDDPMTASDLPWMFQTEREEESNG